MSRLHLNDFALALQIIPKTLNTITFGNLFYGHSVAQQLAITTEGKILLEINKENVINVGCMLHLFVAPLKRHTEDYEAVAIRKLPGELVNMVAETLGAKPIKLGIF